LRGLVVIAGDHGHFQTLLMQPADGLRGAVLNRIGHCNQALHFAIHAYQHGGFRLLLQALNFGR
jgi:hypothetical protein